MIRKILMTLDGSSLSEGAVPQAVAVARALDAEVVVLRVEETNDRELADSVTWRLRRAEGNSYVRSMAETLRGQGVRATADLAEGDPAEEILKKVGEHAADLVVLTSHGRGGDDAFSLGATAQKVLSRGTVSVLLVRTAEPLGRAAADASLHSVMVPLDGSPRAQWALLQAPPLARALGSELLLVHVVATPRPEGGTFPSWEESEQRREMAERERRFSERYLSEMQSLMAGSGVKARCLLLEAPDVVQALQKIAADERVSLVVVSAHGTSGAAPWPYGSVADRMIHHGTMPLLVLQDISTRELSEAGSAALAAH
jgi:nucleotide-binding universal stress UspA family protein